VLIVKVQSIMSPSGITTKSPESTTFTCPGIGIDVLTDLPELTPAARLHDPKVNTVGSKVNTSGATVTILAPLLVSDIAIVTWLLGGPLLDPMATTGSGVGVGVDCAAAS